MSVRKTLIYRQMFVRRLIAVYMPERRLAGEMGQRTEIEFQGLSIRFFFVAGDNGIRPAGNFWKNWILLL